MTTKSNKTNTDPYNPTNIINQAKPVDTIDPYANTSDNEDTININQNKDYIPCTELETKLSNCTINDIPEFSLNGIKTIGKIVDVYDGDTCKIILAQSNKALLRFNCRLKFIDTPEIKPLKTKPNRDMEIANAVKCRNKLILCKTN